MSTPVQDPPIPAKQPSDSDLVLIILLHLSLEPAIGEKKLLAQLKADDPDLAIDSKKLRELKKQAEAEIARKLVEQEEEKAKSTRRAAAEAAMQRAAKAKTGKR